MQDEAGMQRITVRTDFGEASERAKALAHASGQAVLLRRGVSGFELWVPAASSAQLVGLLEDIDDEEKLSLQAEESLLENEQEESEEFDDEAYDTYEDEVRSEIMEDIEEARENWAASEEEGWYYPD
jgi:hypothetical protein